MFISNVHIENFRSFTEVDIPLRPFTIIVGNNDTGKSNFIDALNIVLHNNRINYYVKSLSTYDFNSRCIDGFISNAKALYKRMAGDFNAENFADELMRNAPIIIIRLRFKDAKDIYEQSLLRDWLNGDENLQYFEVEFKYFLKDRKKLIKLISELKKENIIEERHADFQLYHECYDHTLTSTNNNKEVDSTKIKNFVANIINAERDTFSSGDTVSAMRIVSSIISSSMDLKDKTELTKRYNDFFEGIQLSAKNLYFILLSAKTLTR